MADGACTVGTRAYGARAGEVGGRGEGLRLNVKDWRLHEGVRRGLVA